MSTRNQDVSIEVMRHIKHLIRSRSIKICVFLFSNICTALVVFITIYYYTVSSHQPVNKGNPIAPSFKNSGTNYHLFHQYLPQNGNSIPYIIGITPTYYRLTQKLDLVSLCQTLMNIPNFIWIVVEDSENITRQVSDILFRCPVLSVQLNAKTSQASKSKHQRGVEQRNKGLKWIRNQCSDYEDDPRMCKGVAYFMDDDNTYDLRLFDMIRQTKTVSVFPVGFVTGLKFEGPICKNGQVEDWHIIFAPKRHIPVDMAAFAVNVQMLMKNPRVKMGYRPNQNVVRSRMGYMESDFLWSLGVNRDTVECKGLNHEVLVWHVKTTYGKLRNEKKRPSNPNFEI